MDLLGGDVETKVLLGSDCILHPCHPFTITPCQEPSERSLYVPCGGPVDSFASPVEGVANNALGKHVAEHELGKRAYFCGVVAEADGDFFVFDGMVQMVPEGVFLECVFDAEGSSLFEGFEFFGFKGDDCILELLPELLRPFHFFLRINLLVLILDR